MLTSPDLGSTFPLSGKEDVQSLFGIYFTYVNKFIDYQNGSVSRGPITRLPFDSDLNILWEAMPLEVYLGLEQLIRNEIREKFIRSIRLTLK